MQDTQFQSAKDAMDYAIDSINYIFSNKIKLDEPTKEWLRIYLPYEYHRQLTNINGEPVGTHENSYNNPPGYLSTKGWYIIEKFRHQAANGAHYFQFSNDMYFTGDTGYFFNSSCTPWASRTNLKKFFELLCHITAQLT